MALDTIGREFGEQGRVPDHVKSTQYVLEYGSDFDSNVTNCPSCSMFSIFDVNVWVIMR